MSGRDIVTWVRHHSGSNPPILLITGRPLEQDILASIGAGANDFMLKPVQRVELTARVSALLLRTSGQDCNSENVLRAGNYVVDSEAHAIDLNGERVALSPREFDLALLLFRSLGHLISREVLARSEPAVATD